MTDQNQTAATEDAERYGGWYPAVRILQARYGRHYADRLYRVGKDGDLRSDAWAKLIDAAKEAQGNQ